VITASVAPPASAQDEVADDRALLRAEVERVERELATVSATYRELVEVTPGDLLRPGWADAMRWRTLLMERLRGRDVTLSDGTPWHLRLAVRWQDHTGELVALKSER